MFWFGDVIDIGTFCLFFCSSVIKHPNPKRNLDFNAIIKTKSLLKTKCYRDDAS